jgi:hypothetical protein
MYLEIGFHLEYHSIQVIADLNLVVADVVIEC